MSDQVRSGASRSAQERSGALRSAQSGALRIVQEDAILGGRFCVPSLSRPRKNSVQGANGVLNLSLTGAQMCPDHRTKQ